MNDSGTVATSRRLTALAVLLLAFTPVVALGQERSQPAVGVAVTSGGRPLRGASASGTVRNNAALDRIASTRRATSPGADGVTKAFDGVALTLRKVGDQLELSWSGHTGPVTILRSGDPGFERSVTTLEDGFNESSLTIPLSDGAEAAFYEVVDASTASRAVGGVGYDPVPAPRLLGFGLGDVWWGDDLFVGGRYLAPIAASNVALMYGRPVRATTVGGVVQGTLPGRNYATQATFRILGDARGGVLTLQVDGARNTTEPIALNLLAPGIVYSAIRGVSWAPSTGKLWVAADDKIDEIDLFRFVPDRNTVVPSLTAPRLSRVTDGGKVLFVESVLGVVQVQQVEVAGSVVSKFADTVDADFTRQVLPVGIAVAPDGSACYLADAAAGRIVRIPADNSAPIEDDWGGKTDWSFADPCGIDASPSGAVYAAEASGEVWQATASQTNLHADYGDDPIHSILVDRELSSDGVDRFFASFEPGFAEVFNHEEIGYGWDPVIQQTAGEVPARHLRGVVYGTPAGQLDLQNGFDYGLTSNLPQRILISNADPDFPYLADGQSTDRVIEISLLDPWAPSTVPVHLRLIDPPDLAPYDAKDLDHPSGFAAFPYEADDNHVSITDCIAAGECGLTLNADGSSPARELTVTPPGPVYLKIPDDVSGESFQVEISKVDPATSLVIPERVLALGPVFTSWKRVFVERDRMFRRGGLLDPEVGHFQPDTDEIPDVLYAYRWSPSQAIGDPVYPQPGQTIAILDTDHPYPRGAEEADIVSTAFIDVPVDPEQCSDPPADCGVGSCICVAVLELTLDVNLSNEYLPSPLDFSSGRSAGFGVVSGCDAGSNQVNAADSCFFDGDLRLVEPPFADAMVEVVGLRTGRSEIPYLGEDVFNLYSFNPDCSRAGPAPGAQDRLNALSEHWFDRCRGIEPDQCPNQVHLIASAMPPDRGPGCTVQCPLGDPPTIPRREYYGVTSAAANVTFEMVDAIGELASCASTDPSFRAPRERHTVNHELGHQFSANPCVESQDGHDAREAWCSILSEGGCTGQACLMNTLSYPWDDIYRFCVEDLELGDPTCTAPPPGSHREGAIRTGEDGI